jgi:hypothetical protein
MTRRSPLFILTWVLIITVVLNLGIFVVGQVRADEAQQRQEHQTEQIAKVLASLQEQNRQQGCRNASDRIAFSAILASLADNFAIPPYPDPERVKAVDQMRDLSKLFASPQSTDACKK